MKGRIRQEDKRPPRQSHWYIIGSFKESVVARQRCEQCGRVGDIRRYRTCRYRTSPPRNIEGHPLRLVPTGPGSPYPALFLPDASVYLGKSLPHHRAPKYEKVFHRAECPLRWNIWST